MKRKELHTRKARSRRTFNKMYLLNIPFIITILLTVSLHYSNHFRREQIEMSYCGDFGLYGKNLKLYKDGNFIFYYHGCSQSGGGAKGKWKLTKNLLQLDSKELDTIFNRSYLIVGKSLISNETDSSEFIICDLYISPFEKNKE